jgi:Ras-related GTP-binding protein C/D
MIFSGCGSLVFVIDAQDDYMEALIKLRKTIEKAHAVNPNIRFEVFIHKVDGLSEEAKMDVQSTIVAAADEVLAEANLSEVHLEYHLTSIYDHSIFEEFSKVVQRLIPQLPHLENLLQLICHNSGMEKAFLFDIASKIYIATDPSPVDPRSYELCSEMIDIVIDVSCIYGNEGRGVEGDAPPENAREVTSPQSSSASIRLSNGTVLVMREVNQFLALLCIIKDQKYERAGLLNYNFEVVKAAINDVFTGGRIRK